MDTSVVCGYDASPEATRALDWAAAEAVLRQEPLRVVMALNWPEGARAEGEPLSYLPSDRTSKELAAKAMDAALDDVRRRHDVDVDVTSSITLGAAIPMLLDETTRASVLVLGARGIGGFERMLLGSVSSAVAERATCPVVVVRPPKPGGDGGRFTGQVVVGLDGSPASEQAIGFAFHEADRRKAGLVAVHALHPDPILQALAILPVLPEEQAEMDFTASALIRDSVAPWRERYPHVPVTPFRMFGHPVTVLGYAAAGALLVVVGTRGRSDVKAALLGSVSRGVLHHATVPVAVVPGST